MIIVNKKKILFIVEAMGGGVFTYIVSLSNLLVDKFDIYVAYGTRVQTPNNYKDYFDSRVNLIKVENFTREINPIKDFKSFLEIKRIARDIKPDVIHLHSSKVGVLGRIAFNGKRSKVFYTPHGYSFLMADRRKYKRKFYKLVEIISAKRNCTTISCSYGEHKETLKLTSKALYVNNGIDISELKNVLESNSKKVRNEYTVFTLGRICFQKNPKLFNEIALACPNVKFLWIGDGELRKELSAPNIEITGWVNRERAIKYAQNTDAFILTSLWEGLPISLLEAMYMKKICIVSNVIGNRDVIHTGKNGFVCSSISDYVKVINKVQNEHSLISELTNNAYNDILSEYNTQAMADKYSDIYRSFPNKCIF
ncbi:glycosyltransferase [Clostridium perfringens]|uniref:glycosyltransferase n=1 Tax=Clostridium perfringens TaxID=1502 RepID=UPI0019CFE2D6|nr:glycosyltransferase [Clostridium perfringens]